MTRHFGLPAFGFGFQGCYNQLNKSFHYGCLVGFLCTMSLGDNTYDTGFVRPRLESGQYLSFLHIGKAVAVGHIKINGYAGIYFVNILSSRSAAASEFKNQLALCYFNVITYFYHIMLPAELLQNINPTDNLV